MEGWFLNRQLEFLKNETGMPPEGTGLLVAVFEQRGTRAFLRVSAHCNAINMRGLLLAWAQTRWGAKGMLLLETALGVAGIALFALASLALGARKSARDAT